MTRQEALAILARYAPDVTPPKTRLADFVFSLITSRGDDIGVDNKTGEWVVFQGRSDVELCRVA